MLEEKLQLVITFHTTTAAMYMDKCSKTHQLPGKLIAVPDQLTAGCGLAWLTETIDRAVIEEAVSLLNITIDGIYEMYV